MTFWLEVGACYLLLLAAGFALGRFLATRGGRRGWGRGSDSPAPVTPIGPTHALDIPSFGSDFDRQLLPGVLFDEKVAEAV